MKSDEFNMIVPLCPICRQINVIAEVVVAAVTVVVAVVIVVVAVREH